MSTPLFVFGTLRDPEVLKSVLGRSPSHVRVVNAVLEGFRLARLPDETYPVLLESSGEAVEGELLFGLSKEDFDRIAFFENQEYRFERCTVSLTGGARQEALYCSENEVEPGATEPWTLSDWQRSYKPEFMKLTFQLMKLYGAASAEEADQAWRNMKEELNKMAEE